MRRTFLVAAAIGMSACAAQAQMFEIVPFRYLPSLGGIQGSHVEGIARDGSVMVGEVCRLGAQATCGARRPVQWLPSLEMLALNAATAGADVFALAASNNFGDVTVGISDGLLPARWIGGPDGTVELFTELTGGGTARDVSADGAVIVGDTTVYDKEAFGYTRGFVKVGDGAIELLEPLPGLIHSRVYAVTADGSVAVGSSYNEPDERGFTDGVACVWTLQTRKPVALPRFASIPDAATELYDISSDGRVAVGAAVFRDAKTGWTWYMALRWVRNGEQWGEPQDMFPDLDANASQATHVSGDGRAALGYLDRSVYLWRQGRAPVNLMGLLTEAGVDLDGWVLTEGRGITDDGRTIVGNARKVVCPCGFCECEYFTAGFRVTLGEPACPADFDGSGQVEAADFFAFLVAFFENDIAADFDASGAVTSRDFFAFLEAFFAGC